MTDATLAVGGRAPLVSVVVPAYNEAEVIEDTLTRLVAHLATLEPRFRWDVVVVDDGSSDSTATIADEFAREHAGVRVLRHSANLGLGQALLSMRGGFILHCQVACREQAVETANCGLHVLTFGQRES